jgi:hydroxyacylglutathione hydrolase
MYAYQAVLFVCDYALPPGERMRLNPYGHADKTLAGAVKAIDWMAGLPLKTVCAYSYTAPFDGWFQDFRRVAGKSK